MFKDSTLFYTEREKVRFFSLLLLFSFFDGT